jgi:hypothetical protein
MDHRHIYSYGSPDRGGALVGPNGGEQVRHRWLHEGWSAWLRSITARSIAAAVSTVMQTCRYR